VVLCVSAAASLSVRLLGGAFTPAVAVYPLLFLWIRMPTIEGPLYHAGILVSVAGLLGHLSPGWGTPFALLNLLPGGLAAFAAPFLSMFGTDLLLERHARPGVQQKTARKESQPGFFPEDVARSMLPLLHRATGANGVFLVVRDEVGALRLSDFLASSGSVPESFLPAPSDPFISAALRSEGLVTMEATVDRRLPWYMEDPGTSSVVMISLSRNGVAGGIYVCDFFSRPAPAEAGEVLLDSAGIISSAWGDTVGPAGGMLADICMELASSVGLKAAVHSMVVNLARHIHRATVTVAVLTENGREFQVYETLGSMSSGRRGRLFPSDKGVAGWAVSNRRVVVRRAVGRGDSSIRPFISDEEPQQQIGSCCVVPLYSERAVFGVLVVESSDENGVTPEHSKQLEAVGAVFGVFSARMAALERIESLSDTDRLTGLPCYASFQEDLLGLVDDVRKGLSVAVLAVDICGFRGLNGEYGPRTCDTLLGDAAKRIAETLGGTFGMTRYSPGRFLVSIPGADRAAAQAYAVRIMEAFSVTPFTAGERELSMSVAVGGAVSRVDRMIPRLPGFAGDALSAVLNKGTGPAVLSVDQFGKTQC
jgi:diguanylate cyclase (GGDEF)-like protein